MQQKNSYQNPWNHRKIYIERKICLNVLVISERKTQKKNLNGKNNRTKQRNKKEGNEGKC